MNRGGTLLLAKGSGVADTVMRRVDKGRCGMLRSATVRDAIFRFGASLGLPAFQRQLSVCAIFKNEAPYLDDWLTFHEGVGVEHFYLYNNESEDGFREVLAPWIAAGKVTLTDWPGVAVQINAYRHCLQRARYRTRWIAFIDLDEFLFSPSGKPLPEALKPYAACTAIFVYWWLYGSSGHVDRPSLPVPEAFTWRYDFELGGQHQLGVTTGRPVQGKCIVNPRKVRHMGVHHPADVDDGIFDEKFRLSPAGTASRERHTTEVLRINHYWARSIQDLRDKTARGRASIAKQKNFDAMVAWDRQINCVEDKIIIPIWERIRDRRRSAGRP
jgi:hypothetical protein